MRDTQSISMAGSKKYDWDDVNEDAKKLDMSSSQFFQFLYTRWKEKKVDNTMIFYIISMLLMAMLLMMTIVIK